MAVLFAQSLLLVVLAVAPWPFGGVNAATQACFVVAVLAALACLAISQVRRGVPRLAVPTIVVPLALGLLLGAAQLIPLEPQTAASLSPRGVKLRQELQSPGSAAEAALVAERGAASPQRQPLSLYPASTRHDLSVLILGVAAFFLGATIFHSPRAQLSLCCVLAVNGAAVALFGLVQKLTSNHALYWSVPLVARAQPFGPFVNRNNAGGYLGLGLAAAIGVVMWVVGRAQETPLVGVTFPSRRRPVLAARLKTSLLEFLARLNAGQLVAFFLAASIVAGIVCSLSRGAWIAVAGAVVVTGLLALRTRRGVLPVAILGFVAIAGIALAVWGGMSQSAGNRLASLVDTNHGLLEHWEESSRAVPDFWCVGSGLGTYRFLYGIYQYHPRERWYKHAENQYLEALVDAGVPGLGLLVLTIVLVGGAVWYVLRKDSDSVSVLFGVVALFAVSAQVLHAFFDFGLYIPSNMITFAVICGAVTGRAAQLSSQTRPSVWLNLPRLRWVPLLLAVPLGAACVWSFSELRRVAVIESAMDGTDFEETPSGATAEELEAAIAQLEAALETRPDDAEAHSRVGVLWTHLYHVRTLRRLRQQRTLGPVDEGTLWKFYASAATVQGRLHEFARTKQAAKLERLRHEPVVADNLQPALIHFLLARRDCPLLAEAHFGLGELLGLVEDPAGDGLHLERARLLAPTNPVLLYQSGLLDFQAGRLDAAYASWKKSLTLSDDFLLDVLQLTAQRLGNPDTVGKILPDSPALLIRVARSGLSPDAHREARLATTQRALDLLDRGDVPEDESFHLRALAYECREQYPEAIESYDRAVRLRPRDTIWRTEYAGLLERRGKITEAIDHVRVLAQMAPGDLKLRAWLTRLYGVSLRNGVGSQ